MKKLSILVMFLFASFVLFAQGVDFQHLTFSEALEKAKSENKLVFMDCYTSWCGPCKMMTSQIFPQKEAGDYFNPKFVCVKYDMEKGEGIELKKKFGVRAFPTFLIIRPDGKEQHRVVGGGDLESFIGRIEKGLNEKTSLLYLNERYSSGKMKKNEKATYYQVLDDAYDRDKAQKVFEELKAEMTNKDKLKADYWPIMEAMCEYGTEDFNFLLANLPKVKKNVGTERVDEFLYRTYRGVFSKYQRVFGTGEKNVPDLADLKKQIEGLDIAQKESLLDRWKLADVLSRKDKAGYMALLDEKLKAGETGGLWEYIMAFGSLGEVLTKEDYGKLVSLSEQVMAKAPEQEKAYMEIFIDNFKRLSSVGVYFEDLTFEQALEKAKKTRSMIFMDCYTSWCGPCKYMTSKVFTQEKVGDFFNGKNGGKHFICVKYDMEKGEGPELGKKFGVRAYPTFVILNSDGTVRHKLVGGGEADQFIERVKEAFDDTKATGLLDAKYNAGERDKSFLSQYVKSLVDLYSPEASKVADELFQSLTDEEKVAVDYWFLYTDPTLSPENSAIAKYLVENRSRFMQSIGKEKVENHFYRIYTRKLDAILRGRDKEATVKTVDGLKKEISALKLSNGKALLAKANIARSYLLNPAQVLAVCEREVNNIPGEEFPISLVYQAKKGMTPALQKRWENLCKKVMANCKNPEKAKGYEHLLEFIRK